MEMQEKDKALLQEAFSRFNSTSLDLERCYRLLESQVRQLNGELDEKNRLLKSTTEEKEAFREQAERNLRLVAVGEMAAKMAHELRNPLGSVELFASLLKKCLVYDPEKVRWAEHISTAVSAMDYALSNLLLFTGKPTPHYRPIDLKVIVEDSRLFAMHLISQNKIQFSQEILAPSQPFISDEDLLRQILLNLFFNAVDAMPAGGVLRVAVKPCLMPGEGPPNREGIMISVVDTGCGIRPEILERIFDPFFTTKDRGAGLGLAIVNNAAQALEGVLRVKSEPGHGTEMILMIPSGQQAAAGWSQEQ